MVDPARITPLNKGVVSIGQKVLYWMERDQRLDDNWAFLHSLSLAGQRENLFVLFLYPKPDKSNPRSYNFMMRGIEEVRQRAGELAISFNMIQSDHPAETIEGYIKENQIASMVCDFNPLREKGQILSQLIESLTIPLVEVDSHNIVPCRYISQKQEYAAYTLRPKISKVLTHFLTPYPLLEDLLGSDRNMGTSRADKTIPEEEILSSGTDHREPLSRCSPPIAGYREGSRRLYDFIAHKLAHYADKRNDPNQDGVSGLSPYLHFGQISAQTAALEAAKYLGEVTLKGSFFDEIIVRKELSDNYCLNNPYYDRFMGFPTWARQSLIDHGQDRREYLYSLEDFEKARTHDPLWNAAQLQMVQEGIMHGFMRMYWAKKILEWSVDAQTAMKVAVTLNDKYSLDGKDPNGYAGCAWAIGGLHDRAWQTRSVFGQIRYMNYNGCKRKFDINQYIGNYNRHG